MHYFLITSILRVAFVLDPLQFMLMKHKLYYTVLKLLCKNIKIVKS